MKKEFEIYQDNKGNVYTITTELEELLLNDLVELHSIIKEVREYIEEHRIQNKYSFEYDLFQRNTRVSELLEILDKGE